VLEGKLLGEPAAPGDGRSSASSSGRTTKDVDVVLDTIGGDTLHRSYGVLRRGGRLITLGAPPASQDAERYGVHAMFFVVRPDHVELERLAGLIDEGRLKPVVSQTFPLAEGRRAYDSDGRDRRPGKTVLVVR